MVRKECQILCLAGILEILTKKQDSDKRMAHVDQGKNASKTNDRQMGEPPNQDREPYMQTERQTNAEPGQQNRNERKNGKGANDGKGPHTLKREVNPVQPKSMSEKDKTKMSQTFTDKSYESPEQNAGREELEKGKHLAEDRAKQLEEKEKETKNLKQQVEELITVKTDLQQTRERLEEELEEKQKIINRFEFHVNEDATEKQLLHEEIARLRQDLHHKSEENNKSRGKINELENTCYDLDGKLKGWKMSFQQAQKEHEQEVRKLQQEIESLTKSRDDVRDRLSKSVSESTEGENSVALSSDSVSGRIPGSWSTNAMKNETLKQEDGLEKDNVTLKETNLRLNDELKRKQQKINEDIDEIQTLTTKVERLQLDVEKGKKKNTDLMRKMQEVEAISYSLESDYKRLKKTLIETRLINQSEESMLDQ